MAGTSFLGGTIQHKTISTGVASIHPYARGQFCRGGGGENACFAILLGASSHVYEVTGRYERVNIVAIYGAVGWWGSGEKLQELPLAGWLSSEAGRPEGPIPAPPNSSRQAKSFSCVRGASVRNSGLSRLIQECSRKLPESNCL